MTKGRGFSSGFSSGFGGFLMDMDQGGPIKEMVRTYLGPSLGWVETVENTQYVTVAGPFVIDKATTLVKVSVAGSVSLTLPVAKGSNATPATMSGPPITIVDIGGNAGVNPITISGQGDLIMGLASVQIATPYGAIILIPDQINGGYGNQ